jgi:hypothetical protein
VRVPAFRNGSREFARLELVKVKEEEKTAPSELPGRHTGIEQPLVGCARDRLEPAFVRTSGP